jgi:4-amino-4-deoxy-L-arabinose transferase-like glycosyltransferase
VPGMETVTARLQRALDWMQSVPGLRRLGAAIERNQWFSLALLCGAGLRLLAMLGYPGALWFSGDSYVYLGAALRPRPDLSKTTGYSFFLRALLPFHSLTLVTGLQHLMGLAIAVFIYALLRRSGVSKKWSTIATLPVLLDGFMIEDEHMIMTETLFTFLLVLALLLLLWRKHTSWPVAFAAGLLVGYAVIVRTEGLPVLVLFPVFLLLRGLLSSGWLKWRSWLPAVAMSVGALMPVLSYAGWFHSYNGNYNLTRADGFYLWGRVSSFAECSVIKPPADELKVCPSGTPSSRTPPGNYIWHAPMVHHIAGGPVSQANDTLLRDFAIRAIEAQPLGYLHSVFDGLLLSVEWPRKPYPSSGTVNYYNFHRKPENVPTYHTWIPGGTAYQDAVSYGHASPSTVVEPFAILIAGWQRLFYTWGPLFGVIMLLGLGGVVRVQRRPLRLRWQRRTGSMLPWVTAVVLLMSPIALADFDYRYLLPVLPFACLAAGLAFAPVRMPAGVPPASGDAAEAAEAEGAAAEATPSGSPSAATAARDGATEDAAEPDREDTQVPGSVR